MAFFLNLVCFDLVFQVVRKCRELGPLDGQYEYVTADMSNLTATQYVIRVCQRLNINTTMLHSTSSEYVKG